MSTLLSDLRVIDLTDDFGEAAGRVLADLGAEVIKVEPPSGCASRHRGASDTDGTSFHWRVWGRGKRSVVLDLQTADGIAALHRLL
ncbi:MAG TPA: hypothetical protein DCE75_01640, partial [Acidimicrobiaceae bacterium]|nr:hypothetical protein [Acidimicrobiaceae bacterium]